MNMSMFYNAQIILKDEVTYLLKKVRNMTFLCCFGGDYVSASRGLHATL